MHGCNPILSYRLSSIIDQGPGSRDCERSLAPSCAWAMRSCPPGCANRTSQPFWPGVRSLRPPSCAMYHRPALPPSMQADSDVPDTRSPAQLVKCTIGKEAGNISAASANLKPPARRFVLVMQLFSTCSECSALKFLRRACAPAMIACVIIPCSRLLVARRDRHDDLLEHSEIEIFQVLQYAPAGLRSCSRQGQNHNSKAMSFGLEMAARGCVRNPTVCVCKTGGHGVIGGGGGGDLLATGQRCENDQLLVHESLQLHVRFKVQPFAEQIRDHVLQVQAFAQHVVDCMITYGKQRPQAMSSGMGIFGGSRHRLLMATPGKKGQKPVGL